ncbi:MAG: TIM barrel protein [Desulfobacterales bacterium]|nr:TIM barrel protein [Desulfobacterales bacterium]
MTDPEPRKPEKLSYEPLPESYKRRFHFTLAAPSFIYPDHILPNALMLAPFIDEIELVLFQSRSGQDLPPAEEIRELAEISKDRDLTYNVHLPIDVSITDADKHNRALALEYTVRTVECARSLAPTTWTLHLPYKEDFSDKASVNAWQKRTKAAAEQLLERTGIAPRFVSVETLDFPPEWIESVVSRLDLSVCLDIGHLIEFGYDISKTFYRFKDRISILHLYGDVISGRGHVGLHRLPEAHLPAVTNILSQFTGTVCLEVFSYKDLKASLRTLQQIVENPD